MSGNILLGQDTLRGDYRIIIQGNLGLSRSYIQRTTIIDKAEYTQTGLMGTMRVLWRPDHLLGIGIETGLLRVSNLLVKEDANLPVGSAIKLGAIPILAVFSMEKYGIEISSGVGIYDYHVDALVNAEITTSSNEWEIGWMVSVGYYYPLTRSLGVGGDVRLYAIPERSVQLLSLSAKFQWQLWY